MSATVRVSRVEVDTGVLTPTLRDTLAYDGSGSAGNSFSLPLPSTLQDGDYGVVLVVWAAPSPGVDPTTTLTSATWTTLVAPTTANAICFAVLGKTFAAGDVTCDFTLGDSRPLVATGVWYQNLSAIVDVIGSIDVNAGTVATTQQAPAVTTSATTGSLVLILFAEGIDQTAPTFTVDEGTVEAQQVGLPGTALAIMAALQQTTMGPTNPATASYSVPNASGAALQLALYPTGASRGFPVQFGPAVALTAGTLVLGDAAFTADVTLAATGIPLVDANFGPTVALTATGIVKGSVAFDPSVVLSATGIRAGSAAFRPTVALRATGRPLVVADVALGPHVALAATGVKKVTAGISQSVSVALSAVGKLFKRASVSFGPRVALTVTGTPIPTASVRFGPRVQFGVVRHSPVVTQDVALRPTLTLRVKATEVVASADIALGPDVALTVIGVANLTPVALAMFGPRVVLTADGFAVEPEPVGITLKQIPEEVDSVWHAPGPAQVWDVML